MVLALSVILAPSVLRAQVSWPQYQVNAAHTGYLPVSFDPQDLALDWEVTLSPIGQRLNPVAAVDGRVFATVWLHYDNGYDDFFALDAEDGSILWSKDFGNVYAVNPPSYDDGLVYLQVVNGESDTHLYAYSAVGGDRLYDGPQSALVERYYAPTIVDGTAYVGGGFYGGIYAFNFSEIPPLRWSKRMTKIDEWTPAVDGFNAFVILGSKLTAFQCSDGDTDFTLFGPDVRFETSMDVAPVLGGQDDILVIRDYKLISYDIASREVRYDIWEGFGGSQDNDISGQVSVAKGVIYAINGGVLNARNQADGGFLWAWAPPAPFNAKGNLIVTDSHVFMVVEDGEDDYTEWQGVVIHAIDLVTQESVWSHPIFWVFNGSLAWSEGRLYFARGDGVLTAFKLSGGYEQSPVIQFESIGYTVAEDSGSVNVVLRRTGSGEGTVGATVVSSNASAVAGLDYTAVNQVVTWNDGDTADKTVQVVIQNDSETEGPERFDLRIHSPTGPATLGVLNRAAVTIVDDEIDVFHFTSSGAEVSEDGGSVSIFVERNGPASGEVTVDYATGGGTALPGADFLSTSGTLSWGDGVTEPKSFTVAMVNDEIREDDETFSVSLSEPSAGTLLGSPDTFTVTVVDDDGPRLRFYSAVYQVDETGGSVNLLVERTGTTVGAVAVDWATGSGSATPGQDYVADSGTLNWASGDGSDKMIAIAVLDDGDIEGGESFPVVFSNLVGDIEYGSPALATVSIIDDEALESQINTTTVNTQTWPRAAMDSTGNPVVVWQGWSQASWNWDIFGQRRDTSGQPVGGEFQVNLGTDEDQTNPGVARAADGSFVVAWQGDVEPFGTGVFARRYSAAGVPEGGEFAVNSSTSGNQTIPRMAFDGNGRLMVVWQGRDASGAGVFARVYDSDGSPQGNEFQVNTTTNLSQDVPHVSGSPAGGFVVVWESLTQDDGFTEAVVGRRFDSTGAALGGEIMINQSIAGNQTRPAVVVVGSGRFLVVWEDDAGLDGAFGSIRGRWFDNAGSPLGDDIQINAYSAGDQGRPTAAAVSDGRTVVAWEGRNGQDGSDIGVFQRALYDDGTFATHEIQLNTFTSGLQYLPSLACSAGGLFTAVWTSENQDGDEEGIFGVVWPLPPTMKVFSDGFESGDPSVWSASIP